MSGRRRRQRSAGTPGRLGGGGWLRAVSATLVAGALLAACGGMAPKSTSAARASRQTPPPTTLAAPPSSAPTASQGLAPGQSSTTAVAPPTAGGPGSGCRSGDPLANVYHPYRLKVTDACLSVTGTVAYVQREDDGDVHVDLSLPASESHLLDQANYSHEDGQLVTEIVPADQPGCTPGQPPPLPSTAYRSSSYDYGTCTGADIATPSIGSQVSVTGPYVLDSDHGWMEIHPVWALTVLGAGTAPPQQPTTTAAPPSAGAPPAGTSAWCRASAAPSNDGSAGDYQVQVASDEPNTKATASDAGDTWSEDTNASGDADIRLYHTSPGMVITVTVGAASCSTTA